jgi:tRNA(Ile)-lysidine synthase
MQPIGLNGSKLISDILTDAKIPNHLRSQQVVVHDDEKIIWCVGFAVGKEAVSKGGDILRVSLYL